MPDITPGGFAGDTDITGGADEVEHLDSKTYSSEPEAQSAADAKKEALDKSTASLHVEVIGDPLIVAGATVYLENFRPEIPLKWHITKVLHRYRSGEGFQTQFEADTKFDDESKPPANGGGGTPSGSGTTPSSGETTPSANPVTSEQILHQNANLSPAESFNDDSTGISIEPETLPGNELPPEGE